MLWIGIGFKGDPDPDPAFYHNADQDPDGGSQTNADPDLPFNVIIMCFVVSGKWALASLTSLLVWLETLEKAISIFLHVCFVAHMTYPVGSGLLCTFLQRWVAKLDEHGTAATSGQKDLVSKQDKKSLGRCFEKTFTD